MIKTILRTNHVTMQFGGVIAVNDLNIFLDTVMKNTRYKRWYFGGLHQDRELSERLICVFQEVHKVDIPH